MSLALPKFSICRFGMNCQYAQLGTLGTAKDNSERNERTKATRIDNSD